MSFEVEKITEDVDLSTLIDFTMTFKPLQLTMQNILKRLGLLEEENVNKSKEIERLTALVDDLSAASNKEDDNVSKERAADDGVPGNSELWSELMNIKNMLLDLQNIEEQHRLSIDELYEARKQRRESRQGSLSLAQLQNGGNRGTPGRASSQARASTPEALYASEEELPLGDKILSLAHEDLEYGGETLAATRKYSEPSDKRDNMVPPAEEKPSGENDGRPVSGEIARDDNRTPDCFPAKPFETSPQVLRPLSSGRGRTVSVSLMDKLRKDGDDISYLNRVVAEILGEMKSLHNDLDVLRELNAPNAMESRKGSGTTVPGYASRGENDENISDLLRRLITLEETLEIVKRSSEFRDNGLQEQIDALRQDLRPAGRLTDDDVDQLKELSNLMDKLNLIEDRVNSDENKSQILDEKLSKILDSLKDASGTDSGVHPAQLAMLEGAVSAMEKQLAELQGKQEKDWSEEIDRLNNAVKELRDDNDKNAQLIRRLDGEVVRLDNVKEDKGTSSYRDTEMVRPSSSAGSLDELLQRLNALKVAHDSLASVVTEKTNALEENKADRAALQRLRDEFQNVKRLMELNAQREATEGGEANEKLTAANEQLLKELQRQLLQQSENSNKDSDLTKNEVDRLRDMIQQLDYRKADATLVANKAEREYVENALERLMREVEQVLNATNAGLIDTLDKSLNILRDMIDGKATKQDLARLRQLSDRDGVGASAPDGLTGFKGYRCLGCNRPMDNLRPRSLPSKMSTFLNRNPQNYPQDNVTRSIQQQQQGTALLEQHTASLNNMSGRSGTPPLPPIDGPR